MALECIGISEIRRNISDYFIDAVYKNKLVALSRYEKEKAFLLGEKMLDLLIKPNVPKAQLEVIPEDDGSYTLEYKPLRLLSNGDTYEEAIEDLMFQAKDYAEDYLSDVELYLRDETRKAHLPLIVLISKANSDEEIKELLGI